MEKLGIVQKVRQLVRRSESTERTTRLHPNDYSSELITSPLSNLG
jgi:hypothetical protein